MDYKALRSEIKRFPWRRDAIAQKIHYRIKKNLLHTTFRYAEPQKEKVLYTW
jgi:hypothetical protein